MIEGKEPLCCEDPRMSSLLPTGDSPAEESLSERGPPEPNPKSAEDGYRGTNRPDPDAADPEDPTRSWPCGLLPLLAAVPLLLDAEAALWWCASAAVAALCEGVTSPRCWSRSVADAVVSGSTVTQQER